MSLKGRHFLTLKDFTKEEITYMLDLAADLGIINKSGAWYAYKDGKIGQGRENAKLFLKEQHYL